jgi:hypothetical protein
MTSLDVRGVDTRMGRGPENETRPDMCYFYKERGRPPRVPYPEPYPEPGGSPVRNCSVPPPPHLPLPPSRLLPFPPTRQSKVSQIDVRPTSKTRALDANFVTSFKAV